MVPPRVSYVRGAALVAAGAVALVPASSPAATGGADLPGGAARATEGVVASPTPSGSESVLAGPAAPLAPTASDQAATAEPVGLAEPLPAMPLLATSARRADDPVATDLAPLAAPSTIAAVDGHVVVVRARGAGSELVDLRDPAAPRVVLAGTRPFGVPSAGRDAGGRPVAVVSPCAGTEGVVRLGQAPRCPLRAIDLLTGVSRPLPGTTGALSGDLAGERIVFTRRSPQTGVRLYESVSGAAARAVALPRLGRPGDGWTAASGVPSRGSLAVGGLDVDAAGRLAVVLEYRATRPVHSSGLWLRDAGGRWTRLTTVATTYGGLGTRHVLGPNLDATGVTAYVEGVVEGPSHLARWDDAGAATLQLSLRRSIGRSTILHDAALDGDRLLFVDWLPGAPCGSEGAAACGLRSVGPLPGRP